MQTTYYRCDPKKNTACRKTGCALVKIRGIRAGDCEATSNPDFAQRNEEGKPIVAFVLTRGEDDGTD